MTVWLVESGDYEQRGVDLIASSLSAAVSSIKSKYESHVSPVEWDDPVKMAGEGPPQYELRGTFIAISVKIWTITEYEVYGE